MPDLPTLRVEIDFAQADLSDAMTFDEGTFDTSKFAGGRSFVDVSSDVVSGSITRGLQRSQILYNTAEAGTLTIILNNNEAKYDPTNEDSPYWNILGEHTEIQPMRVIRVRAPSGTDSRVLWTGYVDSFDLTYPNSGYQALCTVHATDALKVLANIQIANTTLFLGDGETTGARIGRVLDEISWPDDQRDVSDGTVTLGGEDWGSDAWSLSKLAAESELGMLYIGPEGSVVFKDADSLSNDDKSKYRQAIFGDGDRELPYVDFLLTYTDQNIANLVNITRASQDNDGVLQSVHDSDSQTAYLTRTFDRSDLYLETDTIALAYANDVLSRLKDPELFVEGITVNPQRQSDKLYDQVFNREIGDRIQVNISPPGRSGQIERSAFIVGITHTWDSEGWTTDWALSDASYAGDGVQNVEREIAISEPGPELAITSEGAHTAAIAISARATLTIINAREAAVSISAGVELTFTAEKVAVTVGPVTGGRARSVVYGTIVWSNPANAIDGSTSTAATLSSSGGFSSQDLWIDQFSPSIPAGATLVGVQFDVVIERSGTGGTTNFYAVKSGVRDSGNSFHSSGALAKQTVTIGGSADTLGFTLADAQASSSGIAIFTNQPSGGSIVCSVYEVTMTVYYTP